MKRLVILILFTCILISAKVQPVVLPYVDYVPFDYSQFDKCDFTHEEMTIVKSYINYTAEYMGVYYGMLAELKEVNGQRVTIDLRNVKINDLKKK
jgi:hypothetical protein